jgi:hypothetical protein
MSGFSRRILHSLLSSFAQIIRWRHRHQLLWDTLLLSEKCAVSSVIKPAVRPECREWTPYIATYSLADETAESTFEYLQHQGVPVMTWPDLPPEVYNDQNMHAQAWQLRHGRIYFPLHQSLQVRDLLACMPEGESRQSEQVNIDLEWNMINRKQWHEWMRQVGRSSLLQSWNYGEAKAQTEGWVVHRGVFSVQGRVIAFVQVLEKRIVGLFRVYRVNRGPLFLDVPDAQLCKGVLQRLKNELSGIFQGRLFSFAPEMPLSGDSIILLSDVGFRQLNSSSWESVWIDLSKELEELRKQLNSKWRNMLSYAERQDLRLEVGNDAASFEWMLKQCSGMMQARGAGNIPEALYRELRDQQEKDQQPVLIFKAFFGEDYIACICVVPHGSAATYLLGWNGDRGRKLKANQFLLWQAIVYLRKHDFQWFDLGGIDEEKMPGIADFKLGVNGERYVLVGDVWKW